MTANENLAGGNLLDTEGLLYFKMTMGAELNSNKNSIEDRHHQETCPGCKSAFLTWAPGFLEKNGQSVRTGSPAPSTLRIAAPPPQDGDPQAGRGDSRVLEPVLLPWARVSGERECSGMFGSGLSGCVGKRKRPRFT